MARHVVKEGRRRADRDHAPILAGQSAVFVRGFPGAGKRVEALVHEERTVLGGCLWRVPTA